MSAIKTATATVTETAANSAEPMSVRAPIADLKRATALLARVADRKSTMPILAHALIRVDAEGTTLAATDLNVTAIVRLPWRGTSGGFTVPAKGLADIVKRLPSEECEITRKGMLGLVVTSGSLASVLHGIPDRDFPKVPSDEGLAWHACNAEVFADSLESVAYAVCKDETRFHLNGIKYECPDGEHATFVATDGHRLALTRAALSGAPTAGVIIPSKGATEIVKVLRGKWSGDVCDVAIKGNALFVRYGAVTLAVKLIDAQFPPYMQVIPKEYNRLATIERKPLIEALKRAALVCTETRGVKLSFASGKVTLPSDDPDVGEASESLTAESEWCESGATAAIGVNARYMLETLGEIDCKHVTLAFNAELDPILVRSTEHAVSYSRNDSPHLAVIMPMRI